MRLMYDPRSTAPGVVLVPHGRDQEIPLQRCAVASNFDGNLGTGFSFHFGPTYDNVGNNPFQERAPRERARA